MLLTSLFGSYCCAFLFGELGFSRRARCLFATDFVVSVPFCMRAIFNGYGLRDFTLSLPFLANTAAVFLHFSTNFGFVCLCPIAAISCKYCCGIFAFFNELWFRLPSRLPFLKDSGFLSRLLLFHRPCCKALNFRTHVASPSSALPP